MNLSAIVLTKNEEGSIGKCLKNLSFADEIIIVDDCSDDNTVGIARELKARVFERKLENDFSKQRNFGLKKARGRWVLFIDADEIVGKELRNEIVQVINDPLNPLDGYRVRRIDIIWGKKFKGGESGKRELLRLARKGKGNWQRSVHETWEIKSRVGILHSAIFHYPHKNLKEFIRSVNYYSTMHAEENLKERKKSNLFKIIFYPLLKFINNWIINKGYKDDVHGFVACLMMSFHSFLSWSKLCLKEEKEK